MLFEYFNEFLGDIVGLKNAVIVLIGLLLVIYFLSRLCGGE